MRREARALATINHPNVTQIYALEESDGHLFLAMACYEGETLKERIAHE